MPIEGIAQNFQWQDAFQIVSYIAFGLATFWIKTISAKASDAEKSANDAHLALEKLRGDVARDYVSKNDIQNQNRDLLDRLREIKDQVNRVEEKLDKKQDKRNG